MKQLKVGDEATLREKVWDVIANTELKDGVIDSIVTDLLEEFDIKEKNDAELKRLGQPVTGDNSSPVQSPSEQEKTSESEPVERITLENWKSLGIKVGDKVRVVSAYVYEELGIYTISNIEDLCYDHTCFIKLADIWWWYEDGDEVYLIRTKEGSLG